MYSRGCEVVNASIHTSVDTYSISADMDGKSYCLPCRFDTLSPQHRIQLRESLLTWLRDPNHVQGLPAYLLNKIAHVLALIFKREYIAEWRSFFSDLLSLLANGPAMADLVLRVCTNIHEEIVAREINRYHMHCD